MSDGEEFDESEGLRYLVEEHGDEDAGLFHVQVSDEGEIEALVTASGEAVYIVVEGIAVHHDDLSDLEGTIFDAPDQIH